MNNNNYRYQLEKYRGRATRHVCPQCGRKQAFTRYIDTYNNNIYINDRVGKCNRLDKCGYHYTPRQYFEDNPWLRENKDACPFFHFDRENGQMDNGQSRPEPPKRVMELPKRVMQDSLAKTSSYMRWFERRFGREAARRVAEEYHVGGAEDHAIFWQIDIEGRLRTGKIMAYDELTGKRIHGMVDWVHAILRREGALPEAWELTQCLYGEELLRRHPEAVVALAEGAKTAHVGSVLMPAMVWVTVDSMLALKAELLQPLRGRDVILFPDQGRGYEEWSRRIGPIAETVGFRYRVSQFVEHASGPTGGDLVDLVG